MVDPSDVKVGQRIYIDGEVYPYRVRIRDDRYIIATKPFNLEHTVKYFIIDLKYKCRGPDNMVFCFGYETDEHVADRLKELQNGEIEVSWLKRVRTHMVKRIK